ncbi:unnamed protein product [Paramecium octaurelia]|uniref:Uncharacterized protein n=1 Tax=Paramecium octaurelia TaxID=43137 RepID=A0A8S1TE10_PAROT|nr:unnamed protein product [Paramecium octaurelia]
MKSEFLFIIYFFLIQVSNQECVRQIKASQSILNKNHKNVLQQYFGALIPHARYHRFLDGNYGSFLKDDAYTIMTNGVPYTEIFFYNEKISVSPMQKYLLNTFKIWLWDFGYLTNEPIRFYTIIIYAVLNGVQTKIYDSNLATSIVTIAFPDQFVERFDVFNIKGNTFNTGLHIMKAEAYYKFS